MKRGVTLVELITALTILSITFGVAIPRLGSLLDRLAVNAAATETASAFALARQLAISRASYTVVRIDSLAGAVVVTAGNDTVLNRPLRAVHGVRVVSNRDSLAYDPIGLGYGASNQSINVSRGSATDTVVVSRLGRVRYK